MTRHRSFRTLSFAFASAVLALAGPVSAQPPGRPASQPAAAASRSDPRGPLVQARAAGDGRCDYLWNGRAIAESGLLEKAVQHVEATIRRLGGVEYVTAANFPAANLQFGEDVPWRCVRLALETVESSGFIEFRIDNPDPRAKPWASPLVFEAQLGREPEPSAEPVYNRVGLNGRGLPTWNGAGIDLTTLRQYVDVTQTMDPMPWLRLDFGDESPYREVSPVLGVLWRARVQGIDMSVPDSRRGDPSSGLRLNATNIDR